MKPYDIYFWEPTLSPHKVDLFEALARHPAVKKVTQVVDAPLSESRAAMGWEVKTSSNFFTLMKPATSEIVGLVENSARDSIHIFSGIHWVPTIVAGLKAVRRIGRRFGIMSEPRNREGLLGSLRLAHSLLSESSVRSKSDFVLAIGRNGPPWFRSAGYRAEMIHPFAYFVGEQGEHQIVGESSRTRVGYLGRLEVSKGFNLFIEVMQKSEEILRFDVAGVGSLEADAQSVAKGSSGNVIFRGSIPNSKVADFMSGIDILVVPSTTKDGWGVVVNEALLAGAAVVVSGFVGASACITDERLGAVVERPSSTNIIDAIGYLRNRKLLGTSERQFRSNWAATHLTASAGSRYLIQTLDFVYAGGALPDPLFIS